MKTIIITIILLFCMMEPMAQTVDYSKMTKGPSDRFTGNVWVDMVISDSGNDYLSSKVYFEPNSRSNWHKHSGRQIIFALSGEGYYKEKGKAIRRLVKGDVVVIEPGVIHSHGSWNGSKFCQSVTMNDIKSENSTTWMNKVSEEQLKDMSANNTYTRIAKLVIDPAQLDNYKHILKEGMETAVRVEPGVLALRAVQDIKTPNQITLLEIYADKDAYESHIKSPHFLKYKNGTLAMVKSLELIDVMPIAFESKPAW